MRFYRALFAGLILLLLWSQPGNLATETTNKKSADGEETVSAPSLDLLWKKTVGVALSIAVSPDGKYTAAVTDDGNIFCFDDSGEQVWKSHLPGVDRVVLSSNGSALAYTHLNPALTKIYLIGGDEDTSWDHKITGAAWAAAASSEPGIFVVGTGERYCYVFTMSGRGRRYRRWRLPGVACSASFSQDGQAITVGTWQDAGVGTFNLKGKRIRWRSGQSDRLHWVESSLTGGYTIVTAKSNRGASKATVHLRNSSLDDLWSKNFPADDLRVDLAAAGEFVAVSYERIIPHKEKEVRENKIALFNRAGQMIWDKGGIFGKWNLLQISKSDHLLVYDEVVSLYVLDQSGKILLKRKLPASIREFVRSSSRSRIAIYCGDGQLCLFSAD